MSCLTCDCSSEYSLTSTRPILVELREYVKNFRYDQLRRLNTFAVIRDGSFFDNNDNTRNKEAASDGKFWNRTWHDNLKNANFIDVEYGLLAIEFGDVIVNNLEECDGKLEAYIIIADSPTRDNELEPEVLYEFLQDVGIDVYSTLKNRFYNAIHPNTQFKIRRVDPEMVDNLAAVMINIVFYYNINSRGYSDLDLTTPTSTGYANG